MKELTLSKAELLTLDKRLETLSKMIQGDFARLRHAVARSATLIHGEAANVRKALEDDPAYLKEYRELAERHAKKTPDGNTALTEKGDIIIGDVAALRVAAKELDKKWNMEKVEAERRQLLAEAITVKYHPVPTAAGLPPQFTAEHEGWLMPLFDNPDYEPPEPEPKPKG